MIVKLKPSVHTVLTLLEKDKHVTKAECRNGFCSACKCRLIEGKIEYETYPLAAHNSDEILICCAIPLTEIEIQIDLSK